MEYPGRVDKENNNSYRSRYLAVNASKVNVWLSAITAWTTESISELNNRSARSLACSKRTPSVSKELTFSVNSSVALAFKVASSITPSSSSIKEIARTAIM
jgi:hypothetical protein